ncbi:MAG: TIGR03790 family protein [Nitrospirales bacterium]|nr:TIGR03790 family protein [Nitrospira sp.]MDR4501470.1 TIGR03790 family protein [Nitrospirales bacterium]
MCRAQPVMGLLMSLLLMILPELVFAELRPDQIVILANQNSHESGSVARHYAKKRGIPGSHIVNVDTSTQETISRKDYEEFILEPLRKALETRKLSSKICVLVTTFGIPLRVKAPSPSPQEKSWRQDAKAWRKSAGEFLQELTDRVMAIATSERFSQESRDAEDGQWDQRASESLIQRLNQATQEAYQRVERLSDDEERSAQLHLLEKTIKQIYGLAGQVQIAQHAEGKGATADDIPLSSFLAKLRSAEQMLALFQASPSDKSRELAYRVAQEHFGVMGVLRLANREVQQFGYEQADASVDSELSLLWWDRASGHPSGKLPNPWYAWYPESSRDQMMGLPVLLVSRLDAPTSALAKQLVDHAVRAEQDGLVGNAYFDARGMDSEQPLSYGHYDRDIRNLSELVRNLSAYPVILENTQKRFNQPGDAPDVALYVGWYRLRHYEDAFTFLPGSIGYHIASGEAVSLRDPIERGWCKNALERGITATLGPIGEPYLDAFPLPTQFFGLLLTGRYSLVEAFYLTSRHVSWRMVLVGDPLYNPWKDGRFAEKVKASGVLRLESWPIPPSERDFPDPVRMRKIMNEERTRILSRLSSSAGR